MSDNTKNLFIAGAAVLVIASLAAWLLKAVGIIPLAIGCIIVVYFGWSRWKK